MFCEYQQPFSKVNTSCIRISILILIMSDYIPNQNRFINSWLFEECDLDDILLLESLNLLPNKWEHNRIDWNYHLSKKIHEKTFERTYRMSYKAFKKLHMMLYPDLKKKNQSAEV